ncbi:MAG: TRAP transporter fused permease subunit [Deltaproteobacteria bacterium]|nr:TRAP transporter fused permease subunit [Deltaproteobacteria bacterium]
MAEDRGWGVRLKPVAIVAFLWSCFQLYVIFAGFMDPMILYPVHTVFGIAVGILAKPLSLKNRILRGLDYVLVFLIGGVGLYMVANFERISTRTPFVQALEPLDYAVGVILVLLLLEVCRRTMVFYFILCGTFLERSGGGALFTDLAILVTGKFRGGAAKMSVVASALYGTISGSAVANVSVVGMFTIPLMKKTGFRPFFAGAIEAVASTGGQIMPPIMGAAAFILAQILGISYWKVAAAAAIPALLYYIAVYAAIDFESMQNGLVGLTKNELPDVRSGILKRIHLIFPLLLLIYYIVSFTATPVTAAARAIIAVIVVSFLRRETRMGPRKIFDAMEKGAREAVTVAIPCAMAGVLIGVIIYSGLALKLTDILIALSGGKLLLALILVMVAVIILGMGMPTSAAYLIAAILLAPLLIKLGVMPLAAHIFIFYFAVISMITPPVALASYVAAGMAESDLWKTGLQAFKIAMPSFLVPFVIVYNPALILEGSLWDIIWVTFTTMIGVIALAAATIGFFYRKARLWERAVLIVGGLLLIVPETITDFIGFAMMGVVLAVQLRRPSDLVKRTLPVS